MWQITDYIGIALAIILLLFSIDYTMKEERKKHKEDQDNNEKD